MDDRTKIDKPKLESAFLYDDRNVTEARCGVLAFGLIGSQKNPTSKERIADGRRHHWA
jgi:hypothetical protein